MNAIAKLITLWVIVPVLVIVLVLNSGSLIGPILGGMLLLGYVVERIYFRGKRYKKSEMSNRTVIKSTFRASKTDLLISSIWDLRQADKLSLTDGEYSVRISEKFQGSFSLISKVTIERSKEQLGKTKLGSIQMDVDTGLLIFLLSSQTEHFPPAKLERLILKEYDNLPRGKPLYFWLTDEAATIVGIVVSTGEGDASYKIRHQTKGGVLTWIEVVFIGR
ncbi:MAG: hypothetical protein ACAI35_12350 [Candidatus Methylacidiphilales bacterium]|nr:hypothetical protein [Candidatus Methylacidiphilales bacterium]